MHFDIPNHAGANAITGSAQAHGIPVVSAKQMLTWLDGRNGSSFGNLTWTNNTLNYFLNFNISVGAGANNLKGMLPVNSENGELIQLTVGGSSVPFTTEIIKGINYAFFNATAGSYVATYGVDDIAPVISNVVATPHADGTATITWTTDEASDSRVNYGTVSGTLGSNVSAGAMVTSHTVTLTGLAPTTVYYYRVTSTDDATNSASMPVAPAEFSFTTPAGICAMDRTLADFSFGTPDANTLVALDGDGAVILKPGFIEDFAGSSLPAGWGEAIFTGGTLPVYSGGQVAVNGSHIFSNTTFGPGTTMEFVATFTAGDFQNVGFSTGGTEFGPPWVVIGKGTQGDNNIYARTYVGVETNVLLGSNLLGSPHNYKIKWNSSGNFEFYVDGAIISAATTAVTVSSNMVIQISDYPPAGAVLSVDWVRATPYVASGSFISRVFDGAISRLWGEAFWTADVPAGTSLAIYARTGNTPAPDGSWTSFVQVPGPGSVIGVPSRFIQYRADLSTTNTLFTPVLKDISVSCSDAGNSAPVVTVHPLSQTICGNINVTFTSVAVGVPAPTVQWEVSTNNGSSWTAIGGATNSTYSFTVAMADNAKQYRTVWTNSQGSATSNAAILTVNTGITAAIEVVDNDLCQGENVQLRLNNTTTGQAPYSVIVNGTTYNASSIGSVFATIETSERTIWASGATPVNATANDIQPGGIEVGVKFRSSVAGYIKGIRFYHGINNSGTYTGHLWSSAGTLLASAVFTNVTTTPGWQEVRFSTPVSITANTTYVASYYSTDGYFAITAGGLSSAVVSGPLTALASGTDGPNGVFIYGGGFPNDYRSANSNYFVDVVFSVVGNQVSTFTYDLTSATDNNGCSITGAPVNSATVSVTPAPFGTITPAHATVYEGEEYELIFDATVGAGPFELVINGKSYPGVGSGVPVSVGTASSVPVSIWPETAVGGSQTVGFGFI